MPYFLVTFTLPAELRGGFFGPLAKQFYDLFFAAVSTALQEKLANELMDARVRRLLSVPVGGADAGQPGYRRTGG